MALVEDHQSPQESPDAPQDLGGGRRDSDIGRW